MLHARARAARARRVAVHGPPAAEGHRSSWSRALVARVEFREWTRTGTLRAPVVQGPARRRRPGRGRARKLVRGCERLAAGYRAGMARAIWSGAISFGLVNIPVKLYSAVSQEDGALPPARLQGQLAHPAEAGEPQHRRGGAVRAAREGLRAQPRPLRGDQARGARLGRAARRRARSTSRTSSSSTRSTRSTTTTPTTWRPAPAPGKAYALLLAGDEGDRAGSAIARVVIRSKEQLVAIRPREDVLTMETMLFGDEVVPPDGPRRAAGRRGGQGHQEGGRRWRGS